MEIRVDEIQPGDTWVGNDNVVIHDVDLEGGRHVECPVDYRSTSHGETIVLQMIRFNGTILTGDDRGYTGWWSLRPDQIIEVLRD